VNDLHFDLQRELRARPQVCKSNKRPTKTGGMMLRGGFAQAFLLKNLSVIKKLRKSCRSNCHAI